MAALLPSDEDARWLTLVALRHLGGSAATSVLNEQVYSDLAPVAVPEGEEPEFRRKLGRLVAWALQKLEAFGLVVHPRRGEWALTALGHQVTRHELRNMGNQPPRTSAGAVAGRRVQLLDLIESGLIQPGAELEFARPTVNTRYVATVTESGRLELESGEEHASPSAAASSAVGYGYYNGWTAWRLVESGVTLAGLRDVLLQRTEGSEELHPPADTSRSDWFGWLNRSRDLVKSGQVVEIPVKDLLRKWGADGRSTSVDEAIDADLANRGLTTIPNFRAVPLAAPVRLELIPDEVAEDAVREGRAEGDVLDVGVKVGTLPSALGGVVSVGPAATITEAVTVMLLEDFSQLPVLAGRKLVGAVTWRSLFEARQHDPDATIADGITDAVEVPYDADLLSVIPLLHSQEFVFVRDDRNEIKGIVTPIDVVDTYGATARPFFMMGEIDQTLRWMLSRSMTLDEYRAVCDPEGARAIENFSEMTMGDYKFCLESPDVWQRLAWPIDRLVFVRHLDEIRRIRNNLMHFNADPPGSTQVDRMGNFVRLLRRLKAGPSGA